MESIKPIRLPFKSKIKLLVICHMVFDLMKNVKEFQVPKNSTEFELCNVHTA